MRRIFSPFCGSRVALVGIFFGVARPFIAQQPEVTLVASPESLHIRCGDNVGVIEVSWDVVKNDDQLSASDEILLYPVGGSSWLQYRRTNGAPSGNATFAVPQTPGEYEVRYALRGSASNIAATSNPVTVLPTLLPEVKVSAAPENVVIRCGDTVGAIQVSWEVTGNTTCASASDEILLYPVGGSSWSWLQYRWTNGAPSGNATFAVPQTPGEYEVRYALHGSTNNIAAVSSVVIVQAQRQPRVGLTAFPDRIPKGGSVKLVWDVLENQACSTANDTLGLFRLDGSNAIHVDTRFTGSKLDGHVTFAPLVTEGEYEFRYLARGLAPDVARSNIFTVTADCNSNGARDELDLANGASSDVNANRIPDECESLATEILSVVPPAGGDTGTVSVVLLGSGFVEGTTVKLTRDGEADILGRIMGVGPEGSTLDVTFDLEGKRLGGWDVIALAPGRTAAKASFTIEVGTVPELWVAVNGRERARVGREETYRILYGNNGNTDAYDVHLIVKLPLGVQYRVLGQSSPDADVDLSRMQVGFAAADETVIPLWVYNVPAHSANQVEIKVTLPVDTWMSGASYSISAELKQQPSLFARTGSIDDIEHSLIYEISLNAIINILCDNVSPAPPFCGIPGHLIAKVRQKGVGAEDDVLRHVAEKLKGTLGKLLISGLVLAVVFIVPLALIEAEIYATLGGLIAGGLILVGGWHIYEGYGELLNEAIAGLLGVSIQSADPNAKTGPLGYGDMHAFKSDEAMEYVIEFENVKNATASVQQAAITDQIDITTLDANSFEWGPISFGHRKVYPTQRDNRYITELDLRPDQDLFLRIEAQFLRDTGVATWRFVALDPVTRLPPEDPSAGFLPPNITPPNGQGSVAFAVRPKEGLSTGTIIRNQGAIVFDANPPILTCRNPDGSKPSEHCPWMNVVDNTPPKSHVMPLPPVHRENAFTVSWAGTDDGSDIRGYTLFVSDDGDPFVIWLSDVPVTSAVFEGECGKDYAFYSRATDMVGNVEDDRESIDEQLSTRIQCEAHFHRADADGDGLLQITDAVRILRYLFLARGVLPCLDAADADDSGRLELTDAVRILQVLFLGDGEIPSPASPLVGGPCGPDPAAGEHLGCAVYENCDSLN